MPKISKKTEEYIKYLKNVANSAAAHVGFKKFYQIPGIVEQIAHSDILPFLKELATKEYPHVEASELASKIYNECKSIVQNHHLSSLKKAEIISLSSNIYYSKSNSIEKSSEMTHRTESPVTHVHISRNHERKASEQRTSKFPSNNYKNNFLCAIPSDSTKMSYDQLHKSSHFKTNPPVNSNDLNKKNLSKVKEKSKENLTRILHSSNEDIHSFIYEDHFNSSQSYSVSDQAVNGSQLNNSISKESSLLHFKNHFSGPESSKIPVEKLLVKQHCLNSHITDSNVKKFPKVRSPKCSNPQSSSNPNKKSIISQRQSTSRPDYSSTTSEFSNDDRPDESKNLAIDTSDSSEISESNLDSKKNSLFLSLEMKEEMFVAKKVRSKEAFKIWEVRNVGSGQLEDRGFSWGWRIEKTPLVNGKPKSTEKVFPLSKSTTSKEKSPPGAFRDISQVKKNIDCDNVDLLSRKLKSSNEPNSCKQSEIKQDGCKNVSIEDKGTSYSGASTHPKKRSSSQMLSPDGNGRIPNDQKYPKVIDNSMMDFITSKKDRRTIYSGRKTVHEIPKLKHLCSEYLKKNLLSINIPRNVDFRLLEPILEVCSPSKLLKVEEQNKHLLKYTSRLWEKYCRGEFKDQRPVEGETWRDVYWKAHNKRDNKLKSLTASISNGIAKAPAERQAKWLNADSKDPERRIKKVKLEEPPKPEQNFNKGSSGSSSKSSGSESSSSPQFIHKTPKITTKLVKKPVAPLMSKTKKMLNLVNRRR